MKCTESLSGHSTQGSRKEKKGRSMPETARGVCVHVCKHIYTYENYSCRDLKENPAVVEQVFFFIFLGFYRDKNR